MPPDTNDTSDTPDRGSVSEAYLDVPCPLTEAVKTKLVGDFGSIHRVRQILLVGEDEEQRITELVLVEHPLELLAGLRDTFPIVGVDDEDDTLRVLEVYTVAMEEKMRAGKTRQTPKTYNASREDGSCPVLRRPRR